MIPLYMIQSGIEMFCGRSGKNVLFQWLGNEVIHQALEGRLLLIHLLCKHNARRISAPCIALRVAGSPGKPRPGTERSERQSFLLMTSCQRQAEWSTSCIVTVGDRPMAPSGRTFGHVGPNILALTLTSIITMSAMLTCWSYHPSRKMRFSAISYLLKLRISFLECSVIKIWCISPWRSRYVKPALTDC